MKVLTITSTDLGISWGPAIHFLELWNAFYANNNRNIFGLAPSWTGCSPIIKPVFPIKFVRVFNVPILRQFIFDFFVAKYLLLHGREYEVIYVRLTNVQLFSTLMLRVLKKRYIIEVNGLALEDNQSSKSSILRTLTSKLNEKILVKYASHIICVSEGIKRTIETRYRPQAPISVITNGVGNQFFKKQPSAKKAKKKLTIIYVGTFTPWDGAREIISLAKHFSHVDFLLVGDGGQRKYLESIAPGNVLFKGWVNYIDLPNVYAAADAAIVLYESQRHLNVTLSSLKTLEYVASKLPVFSTDVPGQEFIQSWGVGVLAPYQDLDKKFQEFLNKQTDFTKQYSSLSGQIFYGISWHRCADMTADSILATSSETEEYPVKNMPCNKNI